MSRTCRAKLSEPSGRPLFGHKAKKRCEWKTTKRDSRPGSQTNALVNSEFLARRGFWFFFPEKKNTNPHASCATKSISPPCPLNGGKNLSLPSHVCWAIKKITSNRHKTVALYCPSREDDRFHAKTRHYGAQQMKETAFETRTGVPAYQETKLMQE